MAALPTLDKLGVDFPKDIDAEKVGSEWLAAFAKNLESGNTEGALSLLRDDAYFRDMLALTWDLRTFEGKTSIKKFLDERVSKVKFAKGSFKLTSANVQHRWEDLVWVQGVFSFETDVGSGSGIFRLVPASSANGTIWLAHAFFTNLEGLKGFPEKIGRLREPFPNHGRWVEKRKKEVAFEDSDPTVLIIGGGQSGLDLAARLKALDISTLVIERNGRLGDNWRKRYQALCLHDPVWYDHMPYLPFPPTWPIYTPARKLADWQENYAHALELNVWTSSKVTHAVQDPSSKIWTVSVVTGDDVLRKFKVKHLIFATGFGGGNARFPHYPGMHEFKGQILHSTQHHHALDHEGKKVVLVGSCTSAHDIASDYYEHGIDVTMVQRGPTYIMSTKHGFPSIFKGLYEEDGPPTDLADRIHASYPNHLVKLMHQRCTAEIAEKDKDLLDGLKKRGFKLGWGDEGSGFLLLAWQKGGGYYLDVGASQLIIDGKVKLKNDSKIEGFTPKGLKFENGSELAADVVIFSTGYGDVRTTVKGLCGEEVANKLKPIWGLDAEGEINGAWKDTGVPGLWVMMGNLAMCRFHSKHIALQIKAIEEGIFGERYTSS